MRSAVRFPSEARRLRDALDVAVHRDGHVLRRDERKVLEVILARLDGVVLGAAVPRKVSP